MTSKAELEGLRAHAQALQTEWRSVRAAAPEARLDKERELEAEQLRGEIARMQGVLVQEVKHSGGSTEDALAAMQRAAELERNVVQSQTVQDKGEVDDDEATTDQPPNAYNSSSTAAAPAVPVPGHHASSPQSDEDADQEAADGDEKEEEGSR